MAKKKAPKKAQAEGRSKKEIKQIKSFLKKNGWKETISEFKVSPVELSAIRDGETYTPKKKTSKKGPKKAPKKPKANSKPSKKTKGKKKPSSKKKAKAAAAEDAPYGLKADGTPKKRPGPKKGDKKAKAKPTKTKPETRTKSAKVKPGKKKKAKAKAKRKPATEIKMEADQTAIVLDYLLAYRSNSEWRGATLEDVIIHLTSNLRGVG